MNETEQILLNYINTTEKEDLDWILIDNLIELIYEQEDY